MNACIHGQPSPAGRVTSPWHLWGRGYVRYGDACRALLIKNRISVLRFPRFPYRLEILEFPQNMRNQSGCGKVMEFKKVTLNDSFEIKLYARTHIFQRSLNGQTLQVEYNARDS